MIMDWTQFVTFIIANMIFTLSLWFWSRSESNNDRRDIMQLIRAIHEEIKDFHGRLCTIEERSKNTRPKIIEKE